MAADFNKTKDVYVQSNKGTGIIFSHIIHHGADIKMKSSTSTQVGKGKADAKKPKQSINVIQIQQHQSWKASTQIVAKVNTSRNSKILFPLGEALPVY